MPMSDVAIRVENLSKRYRIGAVQGGYRTLRESILGGLTTPLRVLGVLRPGAHDAESEEIWALKGVSFEVKRGEVVGVIGRNGAGKSTLLKILSRITEPTNGRVEISGHVGSFLEVGTGFHPELTGRENIYLSATILGLKRERIDRQLDEIVAFAEVEKFIDTPVKRYSSGMYVRLAFAVAAHLEPQVLLLDEVLAVGDNRFQRKCLQKIGEVSEGGRTVLFASHNMSALSRLCASAILLDQGSLSMVGPVGAVIERYLNQGESAHAEWRAPQRAGAAGRPQLMSVRVLGPDDRIAGTCDIASPIRLQIDYQCPKPVEGLHVQIQVSSEQGGLLFASADNLVKDHMGQPHGVGGFRSTCTIPANLLAEGRHLVRVVLINLNAREKYAAQQDAVSFWVRDRTDGTTVRGNWAGDWPGLVRPMLDWTLEPISDAGEPDSAVANRPVARGDAFR
jgi:homopolymeric O-antigen transport system ATP-binding protein